MTSRSHVLFAAILASAAACAFWLPALPAARGWFPAPLDDVYIHFDFARSFATAHPFAWIPGQGYSSGETAPLYAMLLAVGHLLGLHRELLGLWAALLAVVGVAKLVSAVRVLAQPCRPFVAWTIALVPLSIGIVDWSLFSGMETGVLAGVLGASLLALDRALRVTQGHARAEWRLGAWGVPLVLLRPECVVVVAAFAFVAARGAGTRSAIATTARVALPGALATLAMLGANLLFTGDAAHAGAQLKLLSSNPYLSDVDRARAYVENLVVFAFKGLRIELAAHPILALAWPALALVALVLRGRRPVALSCVLAAVLWILLASWNGNAPFHNLRYYAPALLMIAIAAALGIAAIAQRRRRLGAVLAFAFVASAASRIPTQTQHFRSAVSNVREQHVELGLRIAALPRARVLLGDAGAIPYVSQKPAVDALGLGGTHGLPFARAAVHGEGAMLELLERLPPQDRPTHLALYPSWFRQTTARFGTEIDRVTIANNVITGGPTKVLYTADWSALDAAPASGRQALDEIDVGDVVSEREHAYVAASSKGGWTTFEVLADERSARRFDAGRILPPGTSESFVVRAEGTVNIRVRTDDRPRAALVRTSRGTTELTFPPPRAGAWNEGRAALTVESGERIAIEGADGELRDYHVWIERR